MSLDSNQVAYQATQFLDQAHHRKDIDVDFNALDLRDQYRVTLAMKKLNGQYEKDHPDLPKVTLDTFQSGQLKELDVEGRIWGKNSCYTREKDPGVPSCTDGGIKSILNCLKEIKD